jgi:hypothetical protein
MNKIIILEKNINFTSLWRTSGDELLVHHHLLPVGTEYVLFAKPNDEGYSDGYMLCKIDSYDDGVIKITDHAAIDVKDCLDGKPFRYTSLNALGIDLSDIQFGSLEHSNIVAKRVNMLFDLPFFGHFR